MFSSVPFSSSHKIYNETSKTLNDKLGQYLEGRDIGNEKGSTGKESFIGS